MQAGMEPRSQDSQTPPEPARAAEEQNNIRDEERALPQADRPSTSSLRSAYRTSDDTRVEETRTRASSVYSSTAYIRKKTSQLLEAIKPSQPRIDGPVPPKLQELIDAFREGAIHQDLQNEILGVQGVSNAGESIAMSQLPDVSIESKLSRGRKRASWGTQFRILSGRAFKNLYRDPALLTAHYVASVGVAIICGFFFQNIQNDIAGFQNRLGVFFFTLALFGFSCLSSLNLFANERILFMRERCVKPFSIYLSLGADGLP